MLDLTIFTCANRAYEDFTPLFVASALWSNPQAHVEVGLEDAAAFRATPAWTLLRDRFGDRFTIRSVAWTDGQGRPIRPGTVRFVTQPAVPAFYTYITDIDIIMLDRGIQQRHARHMLREGLPYSNWVRPGEDRLTGLHFTRSDFQYPLPAVDDLALGSLNDEMALFVIVERLLGRSPPRGPMFRPVHGIHVSPNRPPVASGEGDRFTPGWGIEPHLPAWRRFRASALYALVHPVLSPRVAGCLRQIEEVDAGGAAAPAGLSRGPG